MTLEQMFLTQKDWSFHITLHTIKKQHNEINKSGNDKELANLVTVAEFFSSSAEPYQINETHIDLIEVNLIYLVCKLTAITEGSNNFPQQTKIKAGNYQEQEVRNSTLQLYYNETKESRDCEFVYYTQRAVVGWSDLVHHILILKTLF